MDRVFYCIREDVGNAARPESATGITLISAARLLNESNQSHGQRATPKPTARPPLRRPNSSSHPLRGGRTVQLGRSNAIWDKLFMQLSAARNTPPSNPLKASAGALCLRSWCPRRRYLPGRLYGPLPRFHLHAARVSEVIEERHRNASKGNPARQTTARRSRA